MRSISLRPTIHRCWPMCLAGPIPAIRIGRKWPDGPAIVINRRQTLVGDCDWIGESSAKYPERCCTEPLWRSSTMDAQKLKPAAMLAKGARTPFPGESADYRKARETLVAEEIDFRRHMTRLTE